MKRIAAIVNNAISAIVLWFVKYIWTSPLVLTILSKIEGKTKLRKVLDKIVSWFNFIVEKRIIESKKIRHIAVVIGANTALGFSLAKKLTLKNYHVVLGVKDIKQGIRMKHKLHELRPYSQISLLSIDMTDPVQVIYAAKQLRRSLPRIDVLYLNSSELRIDHVNWDILKQAFLSFNLPYFFATGRASSESAPLITPVNRGVTGRGFGVDFCEQVLSPFILIQELRFMFTDAPAYGSSSSSSSSSCYAVPSTPMVALTTTTGKEYAARDESMNTRQRHISLVRNVSMGTQVHYSMATTSPVNSSDTPTISFDSDSDSDEDLHDRPSNPSKHKYLPGRIVWTGSASCDPNAFSWTDPQHLQGNLSFYSQKWLVHVLQPALNEKLMHSQIQSFEGCPGFVITGTSPKSLISFKWLLYVLSFLVPTIQLSTTIGSRTLLHIGTHRKQYEHLQVNNMYYLRNQLFGLKTRQYVEKASMAESNRVYMWLFDLYKAIKNNSTNGTWQSQNAAIVNAMQKVQRPRSNSQ